MSTSIETPNPRHPAEGSVTARLFSWFPLASFVALLGTMAAVSILPTAPHLAYAVVEWIEMIIGSLTAVIAFIVFFLWPRVASPAAQGWSRYKWRAICGLGIWSVFWFIALATRPWTK
jgi:hypothetical protein